MLRCRLSISIKTKYYNVYCIRTAQAWAQTPPSKTEKDVDSSFHLNHPREVAILRLGLQRPDGPTGAIRIGTKTIYDAFLAKYDFFHRNLEVASGDVRENYASRYTSHS